MFKVKKGGSSNDGKTTWATCGKKHYDKCLLGTGSFFECGKDGHKVKECPNFDFRGKQGNKVDPSVPKEDPPTRGRFYALLTRGEKPYESDDDVRNSLSYFSYWDMVFF